MLVVFEYRETSILTDDEHFHKANIMVIIHS